MRNHNAADPKSVKAQDAREKIDRKQEAMDWEWLLSQGPGKRIVWGLLSECGNFRISFTGHSNTTFFNEGQRNIGLSIVDKIRRARPAALTEMMVESQKREEARNG